LDTGTGALAAVFGEIAEQRVHLIELHPVDQVATDALLGDEVGVEEFFEVEGEGGVGQCEGLTEVAGSSSEGARDH
jgi:hypothetical protein